MMRAPMPKSVKVGAHIYTVLRKPRRSMGGDLGGCDVVEFRIVIAERLRRSMAQSTLLHEILHICSAPNCMSKTQKFTDEQFVCAIEEKLFPLLRDNPDLIAFLTT